MNLIKKNVRVRWKGTGSRSGLVRYCVVRDLCGGSLELAGELVVFWRNFGPGFACCFIGFVFCRSLAGFGARLFSRLDKKGSCCSLKNRKEIRGSFGVVVRRSSPLF